MSVYFSKQLTTHGCRYMRLIQATLALLVSLTFTTITNAQAEEQWLCTSKQTTGFAYRTGKWSEQSFTAGDIFIIKPLTQKEIKFAQDFYLGDAYSYGVFRQGSKVPYHVCDESFSGVGYLYCGDFRGFFSFNKFNLRFTHGQSGGYSSVVPGINDLTDETTDTPFLEIGTCQKL